MDFVKNIELAMVSRDPKVFQCYVTFDVNTFTNDAYTQYDIELPPHISKAVKKRRAEHLAGRVSCQSVLNELHIDGTVKSAKPPERAPIWPSGSVGSIAHSDQKAVAVASNDPDLRLGVDIEKIDVESVKMLRDAKADIFPSAKEQELMLASSLLTDGQILVLGFSAKESLFKALYPEVLHYFGFESAELVAFDTSMFTLRLTCSLGLNLSVNDRFVGQYTLDGDYITTIVQSHI